MCAYFDKTATYGLKLNELYEDDIPWMREMYKPVFEMIGKSSSEAVLKKIDSILASLLAMRLQPHEELAARFFADSLTKIVKTQANIEGLLEELYPPFSRPRVSTQEPQRAKRNLLLEIVRELDGKHHEALLQLLVDSSLADEQLLRIIREIKGKINESALLLAESTFEI